MKPHSEIEFTGFSPDYFSAYIRTWTASNLNLMDRLMQGQVVAGQVDAVSKRIFTSQLEVLIAKFSCGSLYNDDDLRADYISLLDHLEVAWKNINPETKPILGENHTSMLWMVSLGILLDVDLTSFQRVVMVWQRSGHQDRLIEQLMHAYGQYGTVSTVFSGSVSYQQVSQILDEPDADAQQAQLLAYVKKWYVNHKAWSWYQSHLSKRDCHFGYWSFEAAAVHKLLGLPFEPFLSCKYFPITPDGMQKLGMKKRHVTLIVKWSSLVTIMDDLQVASLHNRGLRQLKSIVSDAAEEKKAVVLKDRHYHDIRDLTALQELIWSYDANLHLDQLLT